MRGDKPLVWGLHKNSAAHELSPHHNQVYELIRQTRQPFGPKTHPEPRPQKGERQLFIDRPLQFSPVESLIHLN